MRKNISSEKIIDLSNKRIWIAGHNGMVGRSLFKALANKYPNAILLKAPREELNLTNQTDVYNWLKINKPDVLELLKVLLKHVSEENKVAPKLIAKQIDLEIIASGEKNNLKLFQGWRYEIFGGLVENLIEGKIAIKIQNGKLLILKNI